MVKESERDYTAAAEREGEGGREEGRKRKKERKKETRQVMREMRKRGREQGEQKKRGLIISCNANRRKPQNNENRRRV
jgi:hypothetical protein